MFLITNLHAKEYTFSCISDNKELDQAPTSLIINTHKKTMLYGRGLYDASWLEDDIQIKAKRSPEYGNPNISLTFNKVTGSLTLFRPTQMTDGIDMTWTESCKAVARLMP